MTKTKIFLVAIVALVIGLLGGIVGGMVASKGSQSLGATVYDVSHFVADVHQGANDALIASKGIITGTVGGSAFSTLSITTSTQLAAGFDCSYDTAQIIGTVANATITLPTAVNEDTCLTQDGSWEITEFANNSTNTAALATSTGGIIAYNPSSTASLVLGSSTSGTYYRLDAYRLNSSTIIWTLGYNGIGH